MHTSLLASNVDGGSIELSAMDDRASAVSRKDGDTSSSRVEDECASAEFSGKYVQQNIELEACKPKDEHTGKDLATEKGKDVPHPSREVPEDANSVSLFPGTEISRHFLSLCCALLGASQYSLETGRLSANWVNLIPRYAEPPLTSTSRQDILGGVR